MPVNDSTFGDGEIIDGKFLVEGVCSTAGGMGTLIFVTPLQAGYKFKLVLKYCRDPSNEVRQRFRREVRMLAEFSGNSKIVEIVDHNVDHDPPYFVMRYYPEGDLLSVAPRLQTDVGYQERTFGQMIECLAELHSRDKYHRDVKPQNFLVHGDTVVVSDFGLSKQLGGHTAGTQSSEAWGTHGYIPPEFFSGGFKSVTASSDIFMLGKTFYVLLTSRDPNYLVPDGIPASIFAAIERCCETKPEARYQDLATLKQRLTAAYDVLLSRGAGSGMAAQLLAQINDKLKSDNTASSAEVIRFIEALAMLDEEDRTQVLFEMDADQFRVLVMPAVQPRLPAFIRIYQEMVENATYSFSYAEVIASNMMVLFRAPSVADTDKTKALELAIIAATRQHRYAAMNTCISMIKSVSNEQLGYRVADMLMQHREYFIQNIEPSECHSDAVIAAIKQLNQPSQEP